MHEQDAMTWFEIPAADIARATRFYEKILGVRLAPETMGRNRMAVFPHGETGVGGCVIEGDGYRPSRDGNVVYLRTTAFDDVLARVRSAGGDVALAKTEIPGMGWYAHVIDSEGNRVGLYADA